MNGCSKCVADSTGKFTAFDSIKYNKCVEVLTDFCFIADKVSKLCKVCLPGYFLNYDGMCEQLRLPNCSETGSGFFDYYLDYLDVTVDTSNAPTTLTNITQESRYNFLTYNGLLGLGKPYGCQSCSANYKKISGKNFLMCIQSTYVSNKTYSTRTFSAYDVNCKNYYAEDQIIKCKVCNTPYMASDDGKCVP